jgi:hypothetical protein
MRKATTPWQTSWMTAEKSRMIKVIIIDTNSKFKNQNGK